MSSNSTARRKSDDLAPSAANIASDLREIGAAAKHMAADGADAMRDAAHQYLDDRRARLRHLGEGMHAKVQDEPLKALLIAVGVGFLLGAIWTRR